MLHFFKKDDQFKKAESAFEVINELMGEIHAARMVGAIALNKPKTFQTDHIEYIVRNSQSIIILALRKYDDLWKAQLKDDLLVGMCPEDGIFLEEELRKKKIREFCNEVVAHYAKQKKLIKTSYA